MRFLKLLLVTSAIAVTAFAQHPGRRGGESSGGEPGYAYEPNEPFRYKCEATLRVSSSDPAAEVVQASTAFGLVNRNNHFVLNNFLWSPKVNLPELWNDKLALGFSEPKNGESPRVSLLLGLEDRDGSGSEISTEGAFDDRQHPLNVTGQYSRLDVTSGVLHTIAVSVRCARDI